MSGHKQKGLHKKHTYMDLGIKWGLLFVFYTTYFLVIGILPSSGQEHTLTNPLEIVTTCRGLEAALRNDTVTSVGIEGDIVCTERQWDSPIALNRDVQVLGMGGGRNKKASLEFRGGKEIIIINDGVFFFMQGVSVITGHDQKGGLQPSFIQLAREGLVLIKDSAIGYRDCEDPGWVSAPELTDETSKSCLLEDGSLFVETITHTSMEGGYQIGYLATSFHCGVWLVEDLTSSASDFLLACPNKASTKGSSLYALLLAVPIIVMIAALILVCRALLKCRKSTKIGFVSATEDFSGILLGDGSSEKTLKNNRLEERNEQNMELMQLADIVLGSVLGKGGFSTVYKGSHRDTDVAVKVFEHDISLLKDGSEPMEAYLSKTILHPNIVRTFLNETHKQGNLPMGLFTTLAMHNTVTGGDQEWDYNGSGSIDDAFDDLEQSMKSPRDDSYRTWIVMEYCDCGSLSQAALKGRFKEAAQIRKRKMGDILMTCIDIACAMEYLHSQRIIHGDLKSQNVLLQSSQTDPRGFVCKVGDFGFSRMTMNMTHIETYTCGSVGSMPPELLKDGILTPAVDVYSFGIMLWEMLAGRAPYEGKSHQQIVVDVVEGRRPSIPHIWPKSLCRLLQDCWQQDYTLRPGFAVILKQLRAMLHESSYTKRGWGDSVESVGPGFLPSEPKFVIPSLYGVTNPLLSSDVTNTKSASFTALGIKEANDSEETMSADKSPSS